MSSSSAHVTAFLPPRADECATAARALLARGVGAVVLTLGERGCMLMDQTTGPTDGPLIVPVPVSLTMRARVIDTVGAGDGFLGGTVGYVGRDNDVESEITNTSRLGNDHCSVR